MAVLSNILGSKICVASVPGGYYSKAVATTAAEAGITTLFNSKPTTRSYMVGPCLVHGRYAIKRHASPSVAAGLATNGLVQTSKQAAVWKAQNVAKLAGPLYLQVRARLLN